MKLILNIDAENLCAAVRILSTEIGRIAEYDKPGWGWSHLDDNGVRYFVRGLRDGLSITQEGRRVPPPTDAGGES